MILLSILISIYGTLACVGAYSLINFYMEDRVKAILAGLICALPIIGFTIYISQFIINS